MTTNQHTGAQTMTTNTNLKWRGVSTFYGITQCTPFFATPGEVNLWAESNGVEFDAIMPVVNWVEVIGWQSNPDFPGHYREVGPWPVMS